MVAKALFSFQAQNSRELSFRKGDVIYIKKQVDNNWYEGERNASVGIFPVTYVEILPNNPEVSFIILDTSLYLIYIFYTPGFDLVQEREK